jgi:hypothetical protein
MNLAGFSRTIPQEINLSDIYDWIWMSHSRGPLRRLRESHSGMF